MNPAAPPPPLHRRHDEDIERLLASGEQRLELVELLGAAGYRELSELARRAAGLRRRGSVAYVLPGLMGSRLGTRGRLLDDVVWLDLVEVAAGHLVRLALPRGARLAPLGVMLLNVLKLKLSLQIAGFDARFHAYDWRLGIEGLAHELNARIAAEGVRNALLVGHSMGGARPGWRWRRTGVASRAPASSVPPTPARSLPCSRCTPCTRPCASSPRSTCATTPRNSRGSCSAACGHCTNCCRTRGSAAARTSSTPPSGPTTLRPERRLLDDARSRARIKLLVIGGGIALAGLLAFAALGALLYLRPFGR